MGVEETDQDFIKLGQIDISKVKGIIKQENAQEANG
jgi:hypothetical protein